jgi:hypothetical protein
MQDPEFVGIIKTGLLQQRAPLWTVSEVNKNDFIVVGFA